MRAARRIAVLLPALLAGCDTSWHFHESHTEVTEVRCEGGPQGLTARLRLGEAVRVHAESWHWVDTRPPMTTSIDLSGRTLLVVDARGAPAPGTSSLDPAGRWLEFRPAAPLAEGMTYTASIPGLTGLGCTWTFTPSWPAAADPAWTVQAGITGKVRALALSADRALLLVQEADGPVLHRLDATGAHDAGFGSGGAATVSPDLGAADRAATATSLAATADGGALVAGPWSSATAAGWFVQRIDVTGIPDAAFGASGTLSVEEATWVPGTQADVAVWATAAGGALVQLGWSELAQVGTAGLLDAAFGEAGRLALAGTIAAVAPVGDGAVLVAFPPGGPCAARVARYDGSGVLDPNFRAAGSACLPTSLMISGMAVDAAGRIVVAGFDQYQSGAVVRLLADGQPDPGFGTAGVVTLTGRDWEYQVAAGGGRIVLLRINRDSTFLGRRVAAIDETGGVTAEDVLADDLTPPVGMAVDGAGRAYFLSAFWPADASTARAVLFRLAW